ncbi:hypothetical protein GJ496_005048 [Pomphorhynchus laevis]|nr:hypothetical protein GJ496_005048 [Pomphorhynchus laevis]
MSRLKIEITAVYIKRSKIQHLSRSNKFSTEGYFLAGRNMNWFLIGMSLFSTNIGAEHFLGLASSGTTNGISAAAFEIHAIVIMQLLSWVFVPTLVSSGALTMPQYFSARLGKERIRIVLAVVYLILYILTKVSVNIYAGALFINVAFNLNIYFAIPIVLSLAALFTIGGGLASVMYTDACMSILMILGGSVLCILSFRAVNYMPGLYTAYMNAISNATLELNRTDPTNNLVKCGLPKKIAFQMIRGIGDSYMPWLGFFLGHTPNTIWYWCSDQMMVQRVMAAKSASHARGGMISRSLYVDEVGGIGSNYTNRAYPVIAMNLLPVGLKGLHLAVMISALVSGLTSLFNSSSTLFTLDIYRSIRKKASNMELMIVGRAFALIMIVLAISWIPLVIKMEGTDIYVYIQSVNSFFAAPISCIYLMAVFWEGLSEQGAFWALMSGISMGMIRMILEFVRPPPKCGETNLSFKIVSNVHFMYFSAINFFLTGCIAFVISTFTKKPSMIDNIKGKTFQSRRTKATSLTSISEHIKPIIDIAEEHADTNELFPTTKNKEIILNNLPTTSNINATILADPEAEKNTKNKILNLLRCLLKFICGFETNENKGVTVDTQEDYEATIDKFNEKNISKSTKLLLRLMLITLIVGVILCYIVLSLDPHITFNSHSESTTSGRVVVN